MPTKLAAAAAALSVLTLLGACADEGGGGDGGEGGDEDFAEMSGQEIADAAKADMLELDSMAFLGDISSGGTEIGLDMAAATDGSCTGEITISDGTVELLATSDGNWFRADEAFWRANAPDQADAIITAVGDKWIIDAQDEFSQFCDLDEFRDSIFEEEGEKPTYTNKGTTEVEGRDVVEVESKDDDGTSTGYILVDGGHYLVKIERTAGEQTGTVTFGGFDEPVDATTPSDDEVIDLSSI